MQITRQADYAVRAVLYLAHLDDSERAATSTVAHEQHIPPSFLAKIISQLSIAGLLHTSRGARRCDVGSRTKRYYAAGGRGSD